MEALILQQVFLILHTWKGFKWPRMFQDSRCSICSVHNPVKESRTKFRCHVIFHPLPAFVMAEHQGLFGPTERTCCKTYPLEQVILSFPESQMHFIPLCQHFDCLPLTAVEMIWKTFSLWASVDRSEHRKSVSLMMRSCWSYTVRYCLRTPTPHAHRAEQRHVRSKSIDRPSALECKV